MLNDANSCQQTACPLPTAAPLALAEKEPVIYITTHTPDRGMGQSEARATRGAGLPEAQGYARRRATHVVGCLVESSVTPAIAIGTKMHPAGHVHRSYAS